MSAPTGDYPVVTCTDMTTATIISRLPLLLGAVIEIFVTWYYLSKKHINAIHHKVSFSFVLRRDGKAKVHEIRESYLADAPHNQAPFTSCESLSSYNLREHLANTLDIRVLFLLNFMHIIVTMLSVTIISLL